MEAWKPFHIVTKGHITLAMQEGFLYIDLVLKTIIDGDFDNYHEDDQ